LVPSGNGKEFNGGIGFISVRSCDIIGHVDEKYEKFNRSRFWVRLNKHYRPILFKPKLMRPKVSTDNDDMHDPLVKGS
jgi:hypothetical protein